MKNENVDNVLQNVLNNISFDIDLKEEHYETLRQDIAKSGYSYNDDTKVMIKEVISDFSDKQLTKYLDTLQNSTTQMANVRFKNAVKAAAVHTVLNKCGFVTGQEYNDFYRAVYTIPKEAEEAITNVTSSISKRVLFSINKSIDNYKENERGITYEQNDEHGKNRDGKFGDGIKQSSTIPTGREYSVDGSSWNNRGVSESRGFAEQQVRSSKERTPNEVQSSSISEADGRERTGETSDTHSDNSTGSSEHGTGGSTQNRQGISDVSERSELQRDLSDTSDTLRPNRTDSNANAHIQHNGLDDTPVDDTLSAGVSVNIDNSFNQLSFFNDTEDDISIKPNNKLDTPYYPITHDMIDYALRCGSNEPDTLERIVSQFSKGKSEKENVDFLKKEFDTDGRGYIYIDPNTLQEQTFSAWFDETGITFGAGNTALNPNSTAHITWEQASVRIGEMLDNGVYTSQGHIDNAFIYETSKIAESIWYLYKDRNLDIDSHIQDDFLSNNFPKGTKIIAENLLNDTALQKQINDLTAFSEQYKQNRNVLRYHFYKPDELVQRLKDLQIERETFITNTDFNFTPKFFITEDEKDYLISKGSNIENSKFRISDYFNEEHTLKEKADFLKNEYGVGGTGCMGFNTWHDSKGFVYIKGKSLSNPDCSILMKWNEVAERTERLIRENKYYTRTEAVKNEKSYDTIDDEKRIDDIVADYNQSLKEKPYLVVTYNRIDGAEFELDFATLDEAQKAIEEQIKYDYDGYAILNRDTLIIEDTGGYFPSEDVFNDKIIAVNSIISNNKVNIDDFTRDVKQSAKDIHKFDYKITDENIGAGGVKTKFYNNIEAIKLLKQLEESDSLATPEQQEILAKYVGWGGLSQAFDENNDNLGRLNSELKELLTDDEYNAARRSTLNAHYTAPIVIDAIYKGLENLGFKDGKLLEPAMGIGNFFGRLPENMSKSELYGVELDSISGRIAKQLYQNADISVTGYEKKEFKDNTFDVAIGNVPFGGYKLFDKDYQKHNFLIHDYFFAKTLDKVKPGGIVAFVTSKGTLDKANEDVRKYIAERSEFLGAIRLPNNAFKQNAGTEVTTDILFLQKRDYLIVSEPEWLHLGLTDDGLAVNKYFIDNPDMVLGKIVQGNKLYGRGADDTMCVPFENADLKELLNTAVSKIQGSIRMEKSFEKENIYNIDIPAPVNVKKFSYAIHDDKLYYRSNGDTMSPVTNLSKTQLDKVMAMTEMHYNLRNLLDLQVDNVGDVNSVAINEARQRLNEQYDTFTEKYGRITDKANKAVFERDSGIHLLSSLEIRDSEGNFERKADIFERNTIKPKAIPEYVENADEALILSIAEKAKVDFDYMTELTGLSKEQLIIDLGDKIFYSPVENEWQSADEYLSGNIRIKIAGAEEAGLENNVKALKEVMPISLEATEIEAKLGASWIPEKYVEQFVKHLLKPPYYTEKSLKVEYSHVADKWKIDGYQGGYKSELVTNTYGIPRMNAYAIIEATLNLKQISLKKDLIGEDGLPVVDSKGNVVKVFDEENTTLAQQKQKEIQSKFKDWLFDDPQRRETLVDLYNEKFNSVRLREFDGSHLNMIGMNQDIKLRPHQLNAVARGLYNGNTLLAHTVGAGKTFEMIAIAMEGKRLGLHNKSLFAVPNALTEQIGDDFRKMYPNSSILVATQKDFEKENRKDFMAKIATGDFDAIIVGHTQFDRMRLSQDKEIQYIKEELDKMQMALEDLSASGERGYSVKQIEKAIESQNTKLEELMSQVPNDDIVDFEKLGIDKLFVDESHTYKNLYNATKMSNVAGLGSRGSARSMGMLIKCKYLNEATDNKGVVFASGTPISNSMTEMYTLMRYLQPDKLKEADIDSFDRWASVFGNTTSSMELKPESNGEYQIKTRFSKFVNLPELMNMFKETADIQTADTLNLPRPNSEFHNVVVKPTKTQRTLIKDLGNRAKNIRGGNVDPHEDNMPKLTIDGRKIGLDQRLINPALPDDPNSKVNTCINNVYDIWNKTTDNKSTQLIFCDLSTPKPPINYNTYTVYKKQGEGFTPVYSKSLSEKMTFDKIYKNLSGDKLPKTYKSDKLTDGDLIMTHTVDKAGNAVNNIKAVSNDKLMDVPDEMYDTLRVSKTDIVEVENNFSIYNAIKDKLIAKGVPEKEIAFIHDYDTPEDKQELYNKMNTGDVRVMIGSTSKCGAGMNAQKKMIALHDLDAPMRPSDLEQRHGRILRQGNENKYVEIYRYVTDKTFDAYLYQMLENKQRFIGQIMTSKSPVRSCDDIDEAVLDFAEVKALCAGNPLIKEKIDLEMDISKLNILKAGFNKQKYHSQESIRRIPIEITDTEKKIVNVKQDIQRTENIKPNIDIDDNEYYPIKIKGIEYHDRTDGGKALVAAITSTDGLVTGKNIDLGEYRGFNVSAFYDILSHKVNVCLAGENKYYGELNLDSSTAHSNIVRLDNMIKNLPTHIENLTNKVDVLKGNLQEAERESVKEFPQQQELTEKENRLIEVDKMLSSANSVDTLSKDLYNGLYSLCPDVIDGKVNQQDFISDDNLSLSVRLDDDNLQIFSDCGTVNITVQIKDEFAFITGYTDNFKDVSEMYSKSDTLNEDCVDFIRDILENIEDGEFIPDFSSEHDPIAEDFGIDIDEYSR